MSVIDLLSFTEHILNTNKGIPTGVAPMQESNRALLYCNGGGAEVFVHSVNRNKIKESLIELG